jgi:Extensin-like protein C-terminus
LDVRSLKIANGSAIELTNATVSKSLRDHLRQTACARFSTVLGNGADAYHESHINIDLMQRANNHRICQWNILDPAAPKSPMAENTSAPTQTNELSVPQPRLTIEIGTSNLARQRTIQNPEEKAIGFGRSNTKGIAGFPSGASFKVGSDVPYARIQRFFLRQTSILEEKPEG